MCYRFFIAFALFTGFVHSQHFKRAALSKRYQLGRCPKCPPGSSDLLASSWYGPSRYWGQFASPGTNGNSKNAIFYEPSSPYADSALKQRESIRQRDVSTPHLTEYAPRNYGYFIPRQISPSSPLPTSPTLQTLSQHGFPPERYLPIRGIAAGNNKDHSRFPRHYGIFNQNQMQIPRKFIFKSAQKIMQENRQINIAPNGPTVIDTPWNKKVVVVYRADATPGMEDLNEDKKYPKVPRSVDNVDNNSPIRAMQSMNDHQVEEMMKRALEISTEQNTFDSSHQRRQIGNNGNEGTYGQILGNWLPRIGNLIGRTFHFVSEREKPEAPVYQTPIITPNIPHDPAPTHQNNIVGSTNQGYTSLSNNLPHRFSLNPIPRVQYIVDDSEEIDDDDYEEMYVTEGTEENPHRATIYEMGTLVLPKFTYDYENLEDGRKGSFSKKREISPEESAMMEQSKKSQLSVPMDFQTSGRSNELNTDGFANREVEYEKEETTKSPEAEKGIRPLGKKREKGVEASTLQIDSDFVEEIADPPTTVTESTLERHDDDLEGTSSTLST